MQPNHSKLANAHCFAHIVIKLIFLFCVLTLFPLNLSIAQDNPNKSKILLFTADDHHIGNINAKVIFIEYSALSCPGCASFHREIFPKLKKNYIDSGLVLYIFRDYPANESSLYGAILANCFGEKYFKILNTLFESQKSWIFKKDLKGTLKNISRLYGLDANRVDECFNDKQMASNLLKKAHTSMEILKIHSTPTFFINGNKIIGANNYQDFDKILDKYIHK